MITFNVHLYMNPHVLHGKSSNFYRKYVNTAKKKKRFCLKISLVNVTKSAVNCGFGLIYSRNPL